jgi:hypothetical protein
VWRIVEYYEWIDLIKELEPTFENHINATAKNWYLWGVIRTKNLKRTPAGSSGILLGLRALLSRFLQNILSSPYNRVILTRSDYYHGCQHPNIYPQIGEIYVPNGEECGGVTDIYTILHWNDARRVLNTLHWIVHSNPKINGNLESTLLKYYTHMNMTLKKFNRTMFTIGTNEDHTRWVSYKHVSCIPQFRLKYRTEFKLSLATCRTIPELNLSSKSQCIVKKYIKNK